MPVSSKEAELRKALSSATRRVYDRRQRLAFLPSRAPQSTRAELEMDLAASIEERDKARLSLDNYQSDHSAEWAGAKIPERKPEDPIPSRCHRCGGPFYDNGEGATCLTCGHVVYRQIRNTTARSVSFPPTWAKTP